MQASGWEKLKPPVTSAFVKVDLSYQNLHPKGGDVNPN